MEEKLEPTKAILESGIWELSITLVWPITLLLVAVWFRKEIRSFFAAVKERLRSGAEFSIASFKLGQTPFAAHSDVMHAHGRGLNTPQKVFEDDGKLEAEREGIYGHQKNIFLVHVLRASRKPRYLFDITLYLITHRDGSLLGIKHVDYYFGKQWKKRVFQTPFRHNSFAMSTEAYGPFLCIALITFQDGSQLPISRYVDFEMGGTAPQEPKSDEDDSEG